MIATTAASVVLFADDSGSRAPAHNGREVYSSSVPVARRKTRTDSAARALVREALRGRVTPSSASPPPVVLDARGVRAMPPLLASRPIPAIVTKEALAVEDEAEGRLALGASLAIRPTIPSARTVENIARYAPLLKLPIVTIATVEELRAVRARFLAPIVEDSRARALVGAVLFAWLDGDAPPQNAPVALPVVGSPDDAPAIFYYPVVEAARRQHDDFMRNHSFLLSFKRDAEARRWAARYDARPLAWVLSGHKHKVARPTLDDAARRGLDALDCRTHYLDTTVAGLLRRVLAQGRISVEQHDNALALFSLSGYISPALRRDMGAVLRTIKARASKSSAPAIEARRQRRARAIVKHHDQQYSVVLCRANDATRARLSRAVATMPADDASVVMFAYDGARLRAASDQFPILLSATAPSVPHSGRQNSNRHKTN